jgi:Tfp pilus assembly protein PilO
MASVRELRRGFTTVVVLFLAIDVAAAVVYFSPLASRGKRQDEFARVHRDYVQKRDTALPLRDIDQKLDEAKKQIDSFYQERLPARDSAVAEELGKQAQAAGVKFTSVRYGKPEDTPLPGVSRLEMNLSLSGDYLRIVKLVNQLERDRMFFVVDSVNLAEQQAGMVRLELKIETYLRQPNASENALPSPAGVKQ